ncbi:MAG: cupin domain-containing protein [Gammaproteobacteria bacterium]|nr:MAG: cupin domain-containing protein [Gammaproteobacteria bacterium]
MHVTRRNEMKPYPTVKHHGMVAFRLQGKEASPSHSAWAGLSIFLPGGGAETGSAPSEKVYVVLEGEITVITGAGAVTLGPLDSCLIEAHEERSIENRTTGIVRMLVFSPD